MWCGVVTVNTMSPHQMWCGVVTVNTMSPHQMWCGVGFKSPSDTVVIELADEHSEAITSTSLAAPSYVTALFDLGLLIYCISYDEEFNLN